MALHTVGQMSLDGAWKSSITAWPGSSTISSKTLKVGFPRQVSSSSTPTPTGFRLSCVEGKFV